MTYEYTSSIEKGRASQF